MFHKKIKLIAFLLLGLGLTNTQAQSTMYVLENNGTQTPYPLSSIKNLTFPAGNLQVSKNDGSIAAYTLSNIRYLNFNSLTTNVSQTDNQEINDITLYPNPATDQFQISYNSLQANTVYLQIIDMQGRILRQQTIISQRGINQVEVSLSQLPMGVYICRLQNGNTIKNIKLLKN